jgi:hypothetical protein
MAVLMPVLGQSVYEVWTFLSVHFTGWKDLQENVSGAQAGTIGA